MALHKITFVCIMIPRMCCPCFLLIVFQLLRLLQTSLLSLICGFVRFLVNKVLPLLNSHRYPGPTNPNRWLKKTTYAPSYILFFHRYFHSGTSQGWIDNTIPTAGFPQKTLFDEFEDANLTWKIYYHDSVNALGLANLRKPEMKKV